MQKFQHFDEDNKLIIFVTLAYLDIPLCLDSWSRLRVIFPTPFSVWFGLVLWHINHCRLFNIKSIFIQINSFISHFLVLCQYPAGRPHNLSFLQPLMASDSSSGFSHLCPRVFHIPLQIRKAQPRGWKKRTNEQTLTWVSSKRKKWGSQCDTFCSFCVSVS